MGAISRRIKQNRTLLAQIAFTVIAFTAMGVLGYLFMSDTVRQSLVSNAETVLNMTEGRIVSQLSDYESNLQSYATRIRAMAVNGASAQELKAYTEEITDYGYLDGSSTSGIHDFFCYIESIPGGPYLLRSSMPAFPTGFKIDEQIWYNKAIAYDGVVQTTPIIDSGGNVMYTYAKSIFNANGVRMGVVGLNVTIDRLGEFIVETALNQGGFGMLLNQDGMTLYHPNTPFVGMDIHDPALPYSKFASEIDAKMEVFEQPIVAYGGEDAIAFFRTLGNGWHLGLVTPEDQYYQALTSMGLFIALLAVLLAGILISILIHLDAARVRSDEESRQKSAFLANMSHEIRTPINAIVGMTAIGRTAGVAERKDYCFAKIDDASRHLLGVINDILDMSKIEANKIELSPTDFSFEKTLQQVVNVINFRLDEKQQKLTVFIDQDIPKVLFADDQRIAQVITNLMSNAAKFTPEHGNIELATRLVNEQGGEFTVEVEVIDDGIGISAEQQALLFQSFQQAESSTTRKYGGTGLGLSISKNIAEMMGGTIRVQSEVGKGSAFAFTFKARRGDDKKYGLAYENVNWGNIRILTVDDDQAILEYFHQIVQGFGASCEVASDAQEALRLVKEKGSYNVYFVDLKMPDIDGIALTREIRAREAEPGHSIVIMISSADLSYVEDEARKAGVDRFLLKPIFPSAIADVISECIGIVNEKMDDAPVQMDGMFEGRRILFAEDMEINREIVLALLEPTRLIIDCAENGMEAVNMFIQAPDKYDMVIMDVQMPEMDGYEATRHIRALGFGNANDIPIIAMTANVFKEDVERCLAAGMNGHLGKPLDMNEMLRVLRKYLI